MANRSFYPAQCFGFGRVYAEFGFTANGASAPATATFFGSDFVDLTTNVPTHVGGTAVIGITAKDTWKKVVAHAADTRDDGAIGNYVTVGTFTNEGTALPLKFNLNFWVAAGTVQNNPTAVTVVQLALSNTNVTAWK